MKLPARLALALLATAPLLQAHPGHDGDHDLTWEFAHLARHPLATAGWIVIALAAIVGGWWLARRARHVRDQSLRTAHPSRGK